MEGGWKECEVVVFGRYYGCSFGATPFALMWISDDYVMIVPGDDVARSVFSSLDVWEVYSIQEYVKEERDGEEDGPSEIYVAVGMDGEVYVSTLLEMFTFFVDNGEFAAWDPYREIVLSEWQGSLPEFIPNDAEVAIRVTRRVFDERAPGKRMKMAEFRDWLVEKVRSGELDVDVAEMTLLGVDFGAPPLFPEGYGSNGVSKSL